MPTNNGEGVKLTRLKGDPWRAYEALHPLLRHALQEAPLNYSAKEVLVCYQQHGLAQTLYAMQHMIEKQIKVPNSETWALDWPGGVPPLRANWLPATTQTQPQPTTRSLGL